MSQQSSYTPKRPQGDTSGGDPGTATATPDSGVTGDIVARTDMASSIFQNLILYIRVGVKRAICSDDLLPLLFALVMALFFCVVGVSDSLLLLRYLNSNPFSITIIS